MVTTPDRSEKPGVARNRYGSASGGGRFEVKRPFVEWGERPSNRGRGTQPTGGRGGSGTPAERRATDEGEDGQGFPPVRREDEPGRGPSGRQFGGGEGPARGNSSGSQRRPYGNRSFGTSASAVGTGRREAVNSSTRPDRQSASASWRDAGRRSTRSYGTAPAGPGGADSARQRSEVGRPEESDRARDHGDTGHRGEGALERTRPRDQAQRRIPSPPPPRSAPPRQVKPWESLGWTKEPAETSPEPRSGAPEQETLRGDTGESFGNVRKRDRSPKLPEGVATEINKTVGARRSGRVGTELMEASRCYERERYFDSVRVLRALLEEAPDLAAARELIGLCLYRQGKWAEAIRHLERFAEITGSVEQNPVLADCHRALRHYTKVAELWDELAASSPSAALVTEGRIVMAGALGDQGKLNEAIRLLERAPSGGKRARQHHVRMWYSLADLYERAGDVPRAREMFRRVAEHDPELADVAARLSNLA